MNYDTPSRRRLASFRTYANETQDAATTRGGTYIDIAATANGSQYRPMVTSARRSPGSTLEAAQRWRGGVEKSIITYTNNGYPSACCGEVGLMENGTGNPLAYPTAAVVGTMYAESNYNGDGVPPNVLMATIDCEGACGTSGVHVASSRPFISGGAIGIFSGTVTNGGINKFNTFWNNVAGDVNVTPLQTINTQSRMSIGCDGDLLGCGPTAVSDMILTSNDVSSTAGLPAAIYTYLANIYVAS